MVFTAPAVHYSALATTPPSLTTFISQQSVTHTASVRFKLSRIFKRLLNNEHTVTTELEQHIQLPKTPFNLSETIAKADKDDDDASPSPTNNNSGNRTVVPQVSPKLVPSFMEPLERLPFTEPYSAVVSKKNDRVPFELSAYHQHCIHQQKYIDQKHYRHQSSSINQTRTSSPNPSLTATVRSLRFDSATSRLQTSTDQSHEVKSNKQILPSESLSVEDRIGLQYASRRNSHSLHSSYAQQQTQHLRRLHSKSKARSIPNETKSPTSTSSISSSIAHRIELLKQAMHNDQLDYTHSKSEHTQPLFAHSSISKETQTNDSELKSSEIHLVHHHHIHSSAFLSLPWRTYLSLMGTLSLMFFLLLELSSIIF